MEKKLIMVRYRGTKQVLGWRIWGHDDRPQGSRFAGLKPRPTDYEVDVLPILPGPSFI